MASSSITASRHINVLDGLRFSAAYIVFIGHFSNETGILGQRLGAGAEKLGVVIFFALSGFLMGYLYFTRPFSVANIWDFFSARIARVLPFFYFIATVSFAFFLILGQTSPFYKIDSSNLLYNILLIDGTNILWSIPAEIHFYLAFPLFWFLYQKSKASFIGLCVTLIIVILHVKGNLYTHKNLFIAYIPIFSSGLLCAHLYLVLTRQAYAPTPYDRRVADLLFIVFGVMLILSYPQIYTAMISSEYENYFSLRMILLCCGLMMTAIYSGFAQTVLGFSFFRYLGKISFSIYLLHMPIILTLSPFFDRDQHFLYFITCNIFLVIAASLTYWTIEAPARRKLRDVLSTALVRRKRAIGD